MRQPTRYSYRNERYRGRRPVLTEMTRTQEITQKALFCLIAVACLGAVCYVVVNHGFATPLASAQGAATEQSYSTPQEDWIKGSVPQLYQTDAAWSHIPYAGSTVFDAGCGPTCLNMVYVALTGRQDFNPGTLCAWAQEQGFAGEEGTSWAFFTEGAAALGMHAEELSLDRNQILGNLNNGNPIICSMGPGDFTTEGHFIVLVGGDVNGDLIVHDPNSPERSEMRWSIEAIMAQCRNLWSFSLAI